MSNNSVSITVPDDDPRTRNRRKRKKSGPRGQSELGRRVVRLLLKWWPVLLFVPAAALLLFEASRISSKHTPLTKKSVHATQKNPLSNLNRLDPVTRNIHGVKQSCFKILSSEELEHLDIPSDKESTDLIKNVVYITESDDTSKENFHQSQQQLESSRFNLFTGFQTLEEREQSFKVNETTDVHCGFYSEKGGYKISDEDKLYMQSCKVVVSTCAFGGGDNLYQPIGMTENSIQKVCYVAFWDEITLQAQKSAGHEVGEDHYIGKWRIIIIKNLPFRDQRLNGKIPKMLAHRLFPNAKYSIWVDSKAQFRRDPLGVLEALLWRSNSVFGISEHGARSSVYDEAKAVVHKNKATPQEVEVQLTQYIKDGLPEDKRFHGKKALAEASIIVREHTPLTNLFMCVWFNEVVRFTSRDQLSFPYVLWRFNGIKNINMFPVCIRKDLVNSMGHLRKAKPLLTRSM